MENVSQARIELKRRFAEFLDVTFEFTSRSATYGRRAQDLLFNSQNPRTVRIKIQSHDLRTFDSNLLSTLLENPTDGLPACQDAVREYVKSRSDDSELDEEKRKHLKLQAEKNEEWLVGLEGDLGTSEVSPRELLSSCLGRLVKVYGIVTKCSLVRPKITKSVHYCEATKSFTSREYRDATSFSGPPTGSAMPTLDDKNNRLTTEYGRCKYLDNQAVTIQELPETAPAGQLPHSADVILEGDLVDSCKPGDRIAIYGVYKAYQGKGSGTVSGVCRASLVATSVQVLTKTNRTKISPSEHLALIKLCQEGQALDTLAASLAPSIYGHDMVKRGLVLMLVGGEEKNLENGTHLRGDINCLLVGDPGVAKSQLLRACMNAAPHAVSTTGRGSSGVGLTAAVTTDGETSEKRLEAGAMVLADRGVVCIDEFDKMSDQDRVAIHEVMEQQTVTIAKAGIQASLNARCSVLAAANPLFGTYDKKSSITKNVNLPDSLLSRFDLLFVVLDSMDEAKDRRIAAHVLAQHSYRQPGDDGHSAPQEDSIHDRIDEDDRDDVDGSIFAKYDPRLHGRKRVDGIRPLKPGCLRKFVINLRRRYGGKQTVALSSEAVAAMRDFYIELRGSAKDRALPITARTLETIVRLSTAHAKLRWAWSVEPQDVAVARQMMEYVLRRDVAAEPEQQDEPAAQQQQEQQQQQQQRQRRSRKRKATAPRGGDGAQDGGDAPGASGPGQLADDGDEEMDDEGAEEGAGAPPPSKKVAVEQQEGAAGPATAQDLPAGAQREALVELLGFITNDPAHKDVLGSGAFYLDQLMELAAQRGIAFSRRQVQGFLLYIMSLGEDAAARARQRLPNLLWYSEDDIILEA